MATVEVSEKEARQVAEAARETEWTLPSFGKELFMGELPARPDPPAAAPRRRLRSRRASASSPTLRDFLEHEVDPLQIERDAKIPD